jgi:hypothetical protein
VTSCCCESTDDGAEYAVDDEEKTGCGVRPFELSGVEAVVAVVDDAAATAGGVERPKNMDCQLRKDMVSRGGGGGGCWLLDLLNSLSLKKSTSSKLGACRTSVLATSVAFDVNVGGGGDVTAVKVVLEALVEAFLVSDDDVRKSLKLLMDKFMTMAVVVLVDDGRSRVSGDAQARHVALEFGGRLWASFTSLLSLPPVVVIRFSSSRY